MKASEVMTGNIASVGRNAPIGDAIRLVFDHRISGLPVVGGGGKVAGMLIGRAVPVEDGAVSKRQLFADLPASVLIPA